MLTKLEEDLETETCRAGEIDEIWWRIEGSRIESGETNGVDDGEFGVVGQRVSLETDLDFIVVCGG